MTNLEVLQEYNTEKWVLEQTLCFMLEIYWDDYCKDKYGSKLPENPVSFVKRFMKEETYCEVEFAEKSKMKTLEQKGIIDME